MGPYIIGAVVVLLIIIIIIIAARSGGIFVSPQKAAGRKGERAATKIIKTVLHGGDALFTNVSVSFEGREAEYDDIIVNRFGVFIIEVKNFSGRLSGSVDDREWTKVHISEGGNPYVKTVENPIGQVKREVYILAKYLDHHDVSAWVDGYVMILGASSPFSGGYFLTRKSDIDRVIHTPGKRPLKKETLDDVIELLSHKCRKKYIKK